MPMRACCAEADSDSQDGLSGLSQSRSQGEPVNATMGAVMGPKTRPPAGPKGKKRNEPTRFAQSEKQQSRLRYGLQHYTLNPAGHLRMCA